MEQEHIKKEALFNEVKGSLFEYLVASSLARGAKIEREFQQGLDPNYLTVLGQQDRLVRQYYPPLGNFLRECAEETVRVISGSLPEKISKILLTGKLTNSPLAKTWAEADLVVEGDGALLPVSLKLNKRNAFVNTKSGGVKSFFAAYFPAVTRETQEEFNRAVDLEFEAMARELHALVDLPYAGDFKDWVRAGYSELPGEIGEAGRVILKAYYARLAREVHRIFSLLEARDPMALRSSLPPLMGFGSEDIVQLVCFHDFQGTHRPRSEVHLRADLERNLSELRLLPFAETASVEFKVGEWKLQVRIKPMNKFTTTAIKVNCSVRFS